MKDIDYILIILIFITLIFFGYRNKNKIMILWDIINNEENKKKNKMTKSKMKNNSEYKKVSEKDKDINSELIDESIQNINDESLNISAGSIGNVDESLNLSLNENDFEEQ